MSAVAANALPASDPANTLPSVSVTGTAQSVRTRIDRRVYDLGNDVQRVTGNAADVLNAIPSVEVDADGNVSLRGDSHVTLLVDGKPSAQLTGSNAGDGLLRWSANDIEKIEVLSNPPAQYRSEGTAGVINIITKKSRPAGSSGSLQASVGNRARYVLAGNGAYNSGPLSLSASLGLRQDDRQRLLLSQTTDPASGLTDISRSDQQARRFLPSLKASVDYRLNDAQSMGLDLSTRERSGNRYFDQHDDTQLLDGTKRVSDRHSDGHEWSRSSEQTWRFRQVLRSADETLDADLHRSADIERERYAYQNTFTLPVLPSSQDHLYLNHDLVTTELGLDYALTLASDAKLKLGLALEKDDYGFANAGDNVDANTGQPVVNPLLTNQFDYRQEVDAVYGSWQQTLGDWDTLAGLRGERTAGNGNQMTQGMTQQHRYSALYPSLHLERALSETQTLSLAYSRRVSRPNPEALNPFLDHQDTAHLREGNPNLAPQDTQALELGYRGEAARQSYDLTAYARASRNSMTDMVQNLSSSECGPGHQGCDLTTKVNLPKSNSAGMEFNADGRLSNWWSYKLGGNFFYNQIDATALGASGLKSSSGLNLKLSLDFHPGSLDTAQASLSRSDKRLTPQGYVDAINQLNLGYRHKLENDQSLFVTVSDVFNGQRFVRYVNTSNMTQTYMRSQRGRVIYVGWSWILGAPKKSKAAAFEYEQ
jgi:outer membrane receptor protein involved in Fe transport